MYARPLGTPLPNFRARTHANPSFVFSSTGGRFMLVLFLPADRAAAQAVIDQLLAEKKLFRPERCVALPITRDPELFASLPPLAGILPMLDDDGEASRTYGALSDDGTENAFWILADPTLRSFATGGYAELTRITGLVARLPAPDAHAGVAIHAPVLIVPRVFEPSFCRELIAYFEASGGTPSGVMRQVNGLTTGVMDDDFKRRRDASIKDAALVGQIRGRLRERLIPEVHRAFQFRVTHVERYIVAAYDAETGGHFRPHRDNDSPGTAHRRFACSINLNAEDFEGGDLRFPEYGGRAYRPPTGGAVVFSCALLHEVTPVTRGRRYAVLPFLYDEAAAQIRAQNLHLLAGGEPIPAEAAEAAERST